MYWFHVPSIHNNILEKILKSLNIKKKKKKVKEWK